MVIGPDAMSPERADECIVPNTSTPEESCKDMLRYRVEILESKLETALQYGDSEPWKRDLEIKQCVEVLAMLRMEQGL